MISAVGGASSFNYQSLRQIQQQSPQERFSASDTDGSGGLSLEEYTNFAPDFVQDIEGSFTNIDSDGDGSLTESELASFADSQGIGGPQGGNGGPPPLPPSGGGGASSTSESDQTSLIDELLNNLTLEDNQNVNEFFSALLSVQEDAWAA